MNRECLQLFCYAVEYTPFPTGNGNISILSTDELVINIFKLIMNEPKVQFNHMYLNCKCLGICAPQKIMSTVKHEPPYVDQCRQSNIEKIVQAFDRQMTRICKHCFRAKISNMKIMQHNCKGHFLGIMIKENSFVHQVYMIKDVPFKYTWLHF